MAILDVTTTITGMAGLVPSMIFINTNDTIETLTGPGYLNQLVSEGYYFSEYQIVLAKATDGLNWYQISKSGSDTSLIYTPSAEVLLPVRVGDIAVFTDLNGQIGDPTTTATHKGDIAAGTDGIAGELISYPSLVDKGRFIFRGANNADDFDVILTHEPHAQQTAYKIPDCEDDVGHILCKPDTIPFVEGNLVLATSTNGVCGDSGIYAADVQLGTNIAAGGVAIGGGGAGPISVAVPNCTSQSVVIPCIIESSNAVSVLHAKCGAGAFEITFTGDPGALCDIQYILFRAQQP